MPEYLTTREVAQYLRLNEKKVYALVSKGQLPAARVSGKWLFPRHLVDQWVDQNTVYPSTGLMGAMLDELVVVQGSDDWLFTRVSERFQAERAVPVVSAQVGSLAGLSAVDTGKAHVAGCHVENEQVARMVTSGSGCYLVNLFRRHQGLIFDRARNPDVDGLESAARAGLTFADRQPLSGTYRLAERLFEEAGVPTGDLTRVGSFSSHLELAIAIGRGEADAGVGTQMAAELCGLDFVELCTEAYKLAVPVAFASHPRMAGFLEFVLEELGSASGRGVSGYGFDELGRMEMIGASGGGPEPEPGKQTEV